MPPLLLAHHLADGLQPLQALMASTALAHEIPLYTCHPEPFRNIPDLEVVTPY